MPLRSKLEVCLYIPATRSCQDTVKQIVQTITNQLLLCFGNAVKAVPEKYHEIVNQVSEYGFVNSVSSWCTTLLLEQHLQSLRQFLMALAVEYNIRIYMIVNNNAFRCYC